MRLDRVSVDDIVPAAYNPRKDLQPTDPEYQALERSMERWDVVEPLVWNVRTKHLVSGHQRLKILLARGDTEVDVSVVDLSESEEQALSVALNKITGAWDDHKLVDLLAGLEHVDLLLTGFTDDDLGALARSVDRPLFVPALPVAVPETVLEASTVTEKAIQQAEAKQADRFAGTTKKIQDVTCPHCGQEFGLALE